MKLKLMIAGALAAGMAMAGSPAHAAVIVSGPAAQVHGVYGQSAIAAGTEATYINLDPLATHNVISDATKKAGTGDPRLSYCGTGKNFANTDASCPLFWSGAVIPAGETSAITGTARLAAGTYAFHCEPHGNMKGTLTVA